MLRVCLLALGLLLCIGRAHAQTSYQPYVLGLRTSGMGGAATAFGQDSAMPWINPAGIARAHSDTVSMSANAYMMEWLAVNKYIALSDQMVTDMGISNESTRSTIRSSDVSVFPTSLSYVLRNEQGNHALALSLVVPYARNSNSTSDLLWEIAGVTFTSLDLRRETVAVYDVGPTYSLRLGELTLGLSAFLRYSKTDRNWSGETILWSSDPRIIGYIPTNSKTSAKSYDMEFVAGAQYGPVLGGLYFGLAVHSPTIHLAGNINANTRKYYGDTFADEYSLTYTKLDEDNFESRRPLWFSCGAGYQMPEVFAVAADVSYHLAQSKYTSYSATLEMLNISNDTNIPTEFAGVHIEDKVELSQVFNFNVGAEVYLTDHIILRGGFFTDFSAEPKFPNPYDRQAIDVGLISIDRFGGTLGLAYAGELSQFQLSFMYLGGLGDIIGWEITGGNTDSYPLREIASNTFMMAFSGKIDAASLYASVKGALDEEYDKILDKKESFDEPAPKSKTPPPDMTPETPKAKKPPPKEEKPPPKEKKSEDTDVFL